MGSGNSIAVAAVALFWLAGTALMPFLLPGSALAETHSDRVRIFGVLPIVSPEMLARRFEPLMDHLAGEIGVQIVMETAPNYAEFVRRTHEERRYDYLYTAPHFYFLAQREAGYRLMARVDGERLRAVIVARKDSGIAEPGDLCGKSIATPDPLAILTEMTRRRLIAAGCDPGTDTALVATPSHNASLYSAYRGAADAAGLGTVPFGRADAGVRAEMRIVAETESVPNMPFSVAPWISDEEAAKFSDALVGLKAHEFGPALLEHLSWIGFARGDSAEYDMFEGVSVDGAR